MEALLLLEVGKTWVTSRMLENDQLWPSLKVLLLMAITVGIFGIILLWVQRLTERSLTATHNMVQSIPVPTPLALIHGGILCLIFALFAWVNQLHTHLWLWSFVSSSP